MLNVATCRVLAFADDIGAVRWRVVARNGRELGHAIPAYPDAASALRAFREAQASLAALTPALVRARADRRWWWEVSGPEGAIARSGRSYERSGTCRSAHTNFLEAVVNMSSRALTSEQ